MNNQIFNVCCALLLLVITAPSVAQTCNDAMVKSAPDSRYHDNGDGTVSDIQTGLMWQQCSLGQSGSGCITGSALTHTWDKALQQSESLNASGGFAAHTDWRLPNRKELESLLEVACYSPAINIASFPNTVNLSYWSSSPSAGYSDGAWFVSFFVGYSGYDYRDNGSHVRLVRSGQ